MTSNAMPRFNGESIRWQRSLIELMDFANEDSHEKLSGVIFSRGSMRIIWKSKKKNVSSIRRKITFHNQRNHSQKWFSIPNKKKERPVLLYCLKCVRHQTFYRTQSTFFAIRSKPRQCSYRRHSQKAATLLIKYSYHLSMTATMCVCACICFNCSV